MHNGSSAQPQVLAQWIQSASDLPISSIEQDVLHIGSNGQETLRIGSIAQFGMTKLDTYMYTHMRASQFFVFFCPST